MRGRVAVFIHLMVTREGQHKGTRIVCESVPPARPSAECYSQEVLDKQFSMLQEWTKGKQNKLLIV